MSFRNCLINFWITTFCFLFCNSVFSQQNVPNIVWFVSEDNSASYIGAYGNEKVHTPNIDAFAAQSLVFTNAFSNAPVCAPSRSTIITGVFPPTMGSQHMRSNVNVSSDIRFFPNYLKQNGYYNTLRKKRDYNIPNQEGTWDNDAWWNIEDAFKGREENQPYFMFYNTWMTHEGRVIAGASDSSYFDSTFEYLGQDSIAKLKKEIIHIDPKTVELPKYLADLPEVRKDLAFYYELMQMMDMEFHHVLTQLEKKGELENTIIIYSSDHGGVLLRSKRFTFESGLQVPLMIHFPEKYKHLAKNFSGLKTDKVVSFVDIAPTILAMAGIEKPSVMQGHDFLSEENDSTLAFGFRGRMDESYDMVRSLRSKKYRYIRNYNPYRPSSQRIRTLWKADNVNAMERAHYNNSLNEFEDAFFNTKQPEELYDIETDPDNVVNLAKDPNYKSVLDSFVKYKDSLLLAIRDSGFIPEGLLYEESRKADITYQEYVQTLDLEDIIAAAEYATFSPEPKKLLEYMNSTTDAIRFWGSTGALILSMGDDKISCGKKLKSKLIDLLDDSSGDVAVLATEALFNFGEEEMAIKSFENLLENENPFVVLRSCHSLEALKIKSDKIIENLKAISKREVKGEFEYAIRKSDYLLTIL